MNWLTKGLLDFFAWIFDPVHLLDLAAKLVAQVFALASLFFDEPAKTKLLNMSALMNDVPFQKCYAVGLWLVSPLVDPTLLRVCIAACVQAWLLSLMVKAFAWWFPVGGK